MPATIAMPPATWALPTGSPKAAAPRTAPTTGSRLRKAPAVSGETRAWAQVKSAYGSSVPPTASATTGSSGADPAGVFSSTRAAGTVPIAAAAN